jgi:myo-inositol-1(or 4)-monophosphatase
VTDRSELASALVATGFAYVTENRKRQGTILAEVIGEVRDVRRAGSASLDLAWVAAGRLDAYFESVDKPWDWMAGALLVREAGGRVTELSPKDPALPRIVASAPAIHDALIALLERATAKV